jgi:hypothetical protein
MSELSAALTPKRVAAWRHDRREDIAASNGVRRSRKELHHVAADDHWRSLQPKTAFLRFRPVHRPDLEGRLRVDLTGSLSPRGMAAPCAFETFERRLESTFSGHSGSYPRTSQLGGKRAYGGRPRKDRSACQSRHPTASAKAAFTARNGPSRFASSTALARNGPSAASPDAHWTWSRRLNSSSSRPPAGPPYAGPRRCARIVH